jgi:uncharacterized membrane protein
MGLAELDTLRRAGLIEASQYLDAVYLGREPAYWARWALRALLALGAGHLLAGIVFFFAYNWDSLSPFAKFGILEAGIVTSAVAALILKTEGAAGQVLLIAASVLVGTLLAVFGQVYQTGADAYALFSTWAWLIIPWVLASRSAVHWLVWLVIVYAAASLYGMQVLIPLQRLSGAELSAVLGVATAGVLVIREAAVLAGVEWLDYRWTRLVLAFAGPALVFLPAVAWVLDWQGDMIAALAFVAMIGAIAAVYFRRLSDFAVLAMATGFVALFMMAVGGRVLEETIGFRLRNTSQLVAALALLTLWCAAMTAGTVKLLRILRRQMSDGGADA